MENNNMPPVRVRECDYNALKDLKKRTHIPIVDLIAIAIPLLRKKYRIKAEAEDGFNGCEKLQATD